MTQKYVVIFRDKRANPRFYLRWQTGDKVPWPKTDAFASIQTIEI